MGLADQGPLPTHSRRQKEPFAMASGAIDVVPPPAPHALCGDGGDIGTSTSPPRLRMDSESSNMSDSSSLDNLEPLELDDLVRFPNYHGGRGRFDSINEDADQPIIDFPVTKLFSVAMAMRKKVYQPSSASSEAHARAKANWRKALRLLQARGDPWAKYHWDEYTIENATRHRYNALSKKWKVDKVVVKMEKEPFGRGAMRECFRMKKLSNFSHNQKWDRDSNNYVAKRYMEAGVERDTYFEDVKLQMDAKLWGEEFNRHNPPKKVDIFMMSVFEFHERPGQPLYHIEHFIDGDYIKYNSNSGFVDNSRCRQTPHAFSHFTFERSGHELIVVDVQGVGDLYTDPQIHTAEGVEYGDGNLGAKGMALFFHSHSCNNICRSLGLTRFDLSGNEKTEIRKATDSSNGMTSKTMLRGQELVCGSPNSSIGERMDLVHMLGGRLRANSLMVDLQAARKRGSRRRTYSDYYSIDEPSPPISAPIFEDFPMELNSDSVKSDDFGYCSPRGSSIMRQRERERRFSESSDDSGASIQREMISFQELLQGKQRPSNVDNEEQINGHTFDDSVLGQIHLDLAKYHEICRFAPDGQYDQEAALFHLKMAARCNVTLAIIALAKMYCGLPHDILTEVSPPDDEEEDRQAIGFRYMEDAATAGDRCSMVFVARAFDSGLNLDDPDRKSARAALDWYERICEQDEDEGDGGEWGMDDPPYLLMARQAELLLDGQGDVAKNPTRAGELYNKAAESAMACMKGKLANKYYMLAEEAWAQCDEEEEEGE